MRGKELWQEYNEQGEPMGPVTKSQAATGTLHGASHLWIWRRTPNGIEILLQRRANGKKTWPGYWDISAAGHIDYGETPVIAALRETEEEIGLALKPEDISLYFVFRQEIVSKFEVEIVENEFQFVFGYELIADTAFELTDGEASEVRWFRMQELLKLPEDGLPDAQLVPHGTQYFACLVEQIERRS